MATRFVNSETAKKISREIDHFYGKLEVRYFSSDPGDEVPQNLALQYLFRELTAVKDQTMKAHSEASLREKMKFQKCDLHHMACNEVSYWKKKH